MIIAVDFDGTIVEQAFPEIGKQYNKAFTILKAVQGEGHKLILNTTRTNHKDRKYLDEAVEFCEKNGLYFDAINDQLDEVKNDPQWCENDMPRKIYADVYIDDRNFDTKIEWQRIAQHLLPYDEYCKIYVFQIT